MIILAIALAALSALFWHVMVRRFWIATVLGTITAVLLELVIAGSHFGWMDETFFRNLAGLTALTATVSIAAGFALRNLFHLHRPRDGAL
jgi:hypothetical protein